MITQSVNRGCSGTLPEVDQPRLPLSTQHPPLTTHAQTGSIGFCLFLVVNAALFVRPSEIVADLLGWQIYLTLIVLCLLVGFLEVVRQFAPRTLATRPITVCVLGMLPAILLSLLAQGLAEEALLACLEFAKVIAYYLLLVGLINNTSRLRSFLFWLGIFCVALTIVALLQYHGILDIPTLTTLQDRVLDPNTGVLIHFARLRSTGIFNDPNDLCLLLVVMILLSLYWIMERGGFWRYFWLAALVLFGYGFSLTLSRGGFLALLVGLAALFFTRFGWKKTLALGAALGLPALFVLFAGRQTDLSTSSSTGQDRIQLWSDALADLRAYPLFGIGQGQFTVQSHLVAHNSFLHCFAELGLIGGTLFLGAFWIAAWTLYRISRTSGQAGKAGKPAVQDPELRRLQPYILALTCAYAVGMMSLSRAYVVPTYMVLGLGTVFIGLVGKSVPLTLPVFNLRLCARLAGVSMAYLVGMYVFVRAFIHVG